MIALLLTGSAKAVLDNAALIGTLVALGGVFTGQSVSIALEAQRANETALRNYFEQVGKVLIEQSLRDPSPGDNFTTVVRAQTLTILEGLEPDRKRILLQVLYESRLIDNNERVVSLAGANLTGAILNKANLWGADLSEALLFQVTLTEPRGANG